MREDDCHEAKKAKGKGEGRRDMEGEVWVEGEKEQEGDSWRKGEGYEKGNRKRGWKRNYAPEKARPEEGGRGGGGIGHRNSQPLEARFGPRTRQRSMRDEKLGVDKIAMPFLRIAASSSLRW